MGEEQKEEKVYRIFERISDRYDRANNRISLYMHGRWKMELVKELTERCPLGESMLDVCCGTGDIAVWTAKKGKIFLLREPTFHRLCFRRLKKRALE